MFSGRRVQRWVVAAPIMACMRKGVCGGLGVSFDVACCIREVIGTVRRVF